MIDRLKDLMNRKEKSSSRFSSSGNDLSEDVRRERKKVTILGISIVLIVGILLIVSSFAFKGDGESEEPSKTPSATKTEDPSDGGGEYREEGELKPGETVQQVVNEKPDQAGSCGLSKYGLPILVDGNFDCGKAVSMIDNFIENNETSEKNFVCEDVDWYGYDHESQFNTTVECYSESVSVKTVPQNTKLIPGKPVKADEYAASLEGIASYYFSVPDLGLDCSIFPDYSGGRGLVGCHGDFGDKAKDQEGNVADSVQLDRTGEQFFVATEPSFRRLNEDGTEIIESKELKEGNTIYAYGVSCGVSSNELSCSSGKSSSIKLSRGSYSLE